MPVGSLTIAIASAANAAPVTTNVNYDDTTQKLTMTQTRSEPVTAHTEIDMSKVYTGEDGFYFKALNVDEPLVKGDIVPVTPLPTSALVSREQSLAAYSHPAVADRMTLDAAFHAYDSFTTITRNLLRGRIPVSALTSVPDDLLRKTDPALLRASVDDEAAEDDVDYLGQDEDSGGYMQAMTDGAGTFVGGSWFGFMQVYGHYLDQKTMETMAGFKSSGYGIQAGIVRAVADEWLLGLYGGWQKLEADMRDSDGEVDAGTWRVGPTLAWAHGPIHAEALVTYNWNTIDSKMKGYKGDYKSNQWDGYVRGGYDIRMGSGLTLTPELQFLYAHQKRDDFNWAVGMVEKGKSSGWLTRAGGTLAYERMQFDQPLELKFSLGWQHNNYKTDDLEYEGESHKSDYYDRNGAYYSLGLDTRLNDRLNITAAYAGTWSKNALAHYVQAGLEFRF